MLMPALFGENLFDGFFDDFARPARSFAKPEPRFAPMMRTDVKESETGFELDIELPGFDKENIEAELKDGYLTIKATTKTDKDEKNEEGKYIRRERYFGSTSRTFYVGEAVTEEDIKAKFDNGILVLEIPKKQPEVKEPVKRLVTIQ